MVQKVNTIQSNDTTNLIKNTDYSTKIDESKHKPSYQDKYITTQEFDQLTRGTLLQIKKNREKLNYH